MYEYKCKMVKVVDGDTVDVDIDLGFGVWMRDQRIRLYGIDTPESRTSDDQEKIYGLAAKDLLNLKGEPFLEIDISENVDAKERLKSKGFKTVPQIFYSDGEHYGNYHDLEKKYV